MEIEINGEKYYRNDTRTLQEANINEYDMVEVKILKNGGKPIPGNVTVMDLYGALGDRLKRLHTESPILEIPSKEVAVEAGKPAEKSTEKLEVSPTAPAVPATPASVQVPAAVNAFTVKKPAANAFTIKAPAAASAFTVKKPGAATASAFTIKKPEAATPPATASTPATAPTPTPVPTAPPTASKPNAFSVKPATPFAVKPLGASKFTIKKP